QTSTTWSVRSSGRPGDCAAGATTVLGKRNFVADTVVSPSKRLPPSVDIERTDLPPGELSSCAHPWSASHPRGHVLRVKNTYMVCPSANPLKAPSLWPSGCPSSRVGRNTSSFVPTMILLPITTTHLSCGLAATRTDGGVNSIARSTVVIVIS